MASQPQTFVRPTCILNGKSVHLRPALAQIGRISRELGVDAQIVVTERGDDIASMAARALTERHQPIVAGGGDGTVNAVAGKLAGADTALGVLPMGTLNHFAKDAGIPLNIEAAVRTLFTGQVIKFDVGEVNGRVFVNNSGIGFYPHFVRQREEQERLGHVKKAAFLLAVRALVRRYFRLRMNMHIGRQEALERLTPFLFVGNNRYETSGFAIGTRLRLDSGRLWICTASTGDHRSIVRAAVKIFLGRENDQDLNSFETEEIVVDPGTAQVNVSTDGEVSILKPPLHYRIRPRALGVITPGRPAADLRFAPRS
jgi:diacylglycerol kinase family enzyme